MRAWRRLSEGSVADGLRLGRMCRSLSLRVLAGRGTVLYLLCCDVDIEGSCEL